MDIYIEFFIKRDYTVYSPWTDLNCAFIIRREYREPYCSLVALHIIIIFIIHTEREI